MTTQTDIEREAFLTLAPFATLEDAAIADGQYDWDADACSICDGLGHSTCPLEERGWEEARADDWLEERMLSMGGWR